MKRTPFFVHEDDAPKLHRRTDIEKTPRYSIRKDAPDETFGAFGFSPVFDMGEPEISETQKAQRNALPDLVEGTWVFGWTIRDKTESEMLAEIPWQNATEARKAVVQWINGLTAQIEELYPSAVQKRWEIEEAAARAVKAGTADARQLALVTDEGATKGRTPDEHATAIIANADRFRSIADQTNKLFLATDAQLQAATSPLEYPAIFAWAQSQAAPLAAAYGLQA